MKLPFFIRWYKWFLWDCPIPADAVVNGFYSPALRHKQMQEWSAKEPKE